MLLLSKKVIHYESTDVLKDSFTYKSQKPTILRLDWAGLLLFCLQPTNDLSFGRGNF